jgi:hypothetical protein
MFLDLPVEQVVAGTWDPKKGPAAIEAAMKAMEDIAGSIESDPKAALRDDRGVREGASRVREARRDDEVRRAPRRGRLPRGLRLGIEARRRGDRAHKDAEALNDIAWKIVDPEAKWGKVDLDLALRAAEKGVALTDEKDAAVLDTLARVWFVKGDVAKAIEIETKAVAVASGKMKEDLERALAEYKAKGAKG